MRPEGLQALALATAEARSLDSVLDGAVRGLAAERDVALARVWLVHDAKSLRLVASAGASLDGKTQWTRLDGDFSRMPIGSRKVGVVAATGKALVVEDDAPKDPHIARPEW